VINKLLLCVFSLLVLAGLFAPMLASRDAQFYFDRGLETLSAANPDRKWAYRWDLNSARADFSHAIRLNPDFTAAYTNRAAIECARGNTLQALEDYSVAISLNPQDPNNYMQRAALESLRHNLQLALADYDKAIALEPGNRRAYRERIAIKEMQHDFVGAVMERVRMFEEMGPAFTGTGPTNSGFFLRNPNRWNNRFLGQIDRALETNPDFARGYYYRGVIESLNNDPRSAMADFQRCQNLPDDRVRDYAAVHIWLLQTQSGDRERADAGLRTYCQNRTNGMPADWQMCIAKYLLNQISETTFSKAIDSSDTGRARSEFWYYTGMKHLLTGDKVGAGDCFERSLTATPRSCAVFLSARAELSLLHPVAPAE
jgi:tetratricopeptide (TPR) repeat protein